MYMLADIAVCADVSTQPDYIALAIVAVLAIIVLVMVIRKHSALKKAAQTKDVEVTAVEQTTEEVAAPTAPGSAGSVKLYDVEPKTAAMLMAIVADKTGKPLNELRFISIKEVK